jgi:hypothetical protein
MNDVAIDRLILQVSGLSETEGRRLALLVADGLGALSAAGGGRDVPSLRLDLAVPPGSGTDELARRIVDELMRQVRQLP